MSELVQVKIKGIVTTSKYGTLTSGDILRTDAAFAKHLVDECGAAEYVTKTSQVETPTQAEQEPDAEKPASRRKK